MNIGAQHRRVTNRIAVARATVARREVRILARVLAIALVALIALKSKSLFSQLGNVGRPDPAWLGVAVATEIGSLLAYSLMVRELLGLGDVAARFHSFVRPALAGIAMTASLPAGVGASNVYWFKQLRRHGADRRLAALVMTGTSVAGAISLSGLLAIGVALAGDAGPLSQAHAWLLCVAAAVLVLRLAFAHRLGRLLTKALRRIDPAVEPRHAVRVRRLRMIMVFSHADWLLDCAALYASLKAVHAPVPIRSVILVYVVAQLVAQVALLPGGGGTVELSLAAGFAAFGAHHGSVFAGALLYRFLSCWGLIPVGWLAFILDRASGQRRTHSGVHRVGAVVRPHRARDRPRRGQAPDRPTQPSRRDRPSIPIVIESHTETPRRFLLEKQVHRRQLTDGHRGDDLRRDEPHAVQVATVQPPGIEPGHSDRAPVTVEGRYLGGKQRAHPVPVEQHLERLGFPERDHSRLMTQRLANRDPLLSGLADLGQIARDCLVEPDHPALDENQRSNASRADSTPVQPPSTIRAIQLAAQSPGPQRARPSGPRLGDEVAGVMPPARCGIAPAAEGCIAAGRWRVFGWPRVVVAGS